MISSQEYKYNEQNVGVFTEDLISFKSNNFVLPKTIQVVPCFHIDNSGEVFGMLLLNQIGCLCDFGSSYQNNMSLEEYVSLSIKTKSLDTINIDTEYINENSYVAYKKFDQNTIDFETFPIIFVNLNLENIESLNDIIRNFKLTFSKIIKTETPETNNLVYLSAEDIFYISRNTTYKIVSNETNEVLIIDIQQTGFPAKKSISDIYKEHSASDIPVSIYYNQYANCCPEINFYSLRSEDLCKSFLEFFEANLEIII